MDTGTAAVVVGKATTPVHKNKGKKSALLSRDVQHDADTFHLVPGTCRSNNIVIKLLHTGKGSTDRLFSLLASVCLHYIEWGESKMTDL